MDLKTPLLRLNRQMFDVWAPEQVGHNQAVESFEAVLQAVKDQAVLDHRAARRAKLVARRAAVAAQRGKSGYVA